jgi:hypothetical protein
MSRNTSVMIATQGTFNELEVLQKMYPPRLTTAERTALTNVEQGLVVYDITLNELYAWNGTQWTLIGPSTPPPTPSTTVIAYSGRLSADFNVPTFDGTITNWTDISNNTSYITRSSGTFTFQQTGLYLFSFNFVAVNITANDQGIRFETLPPTTLLPHYYQIVPGNSYTLITGSFVHQRDSGSSISLRIIGSTNSGYSNGDVVLVDTQSDLPNWASGTTSTSFLQITYLPS